ncbi:MAG: arginine--tRNA ligase [Planctomycetota bacterium]
MTVVDLNQHAELRIRKAIARLDAAGSELGSLVLERPRDASHGDLGFPCFQLAGQLERKPAELARDLAERIEPDAVIAQAEARGPFLNLRWQRAALAESVVRGVLEDAPPFGPWPRSGKHVVIDFSSPNIAKPFHIGHLRSTVIGAALRRLYMHAGYEVHGINHLGDWGAQFGKIIVAWREWGDETRLEADPMRHLFEIYVRYQEEEGSRPELLERSAEAFQRLESGEDNEERALWNKLRQVSLDAFAGPYGRLGVEFDAITGESFYEDKMEGTIRAIQDAGAASLSEGALVVDLREEGLPPCMLRKSDGTTIYATRDLAALFYRRETYRFDRALYVVGSEQKLYFRQLKLVLKKLGWPEADSVEHVDFGMILFRNQETGRWEKGKTRSGNVIFLSEVLDEAVEKIRSIIEQKNPDLPDKQEVAEKIGVSAIIFNDLKNGRIKDVKFDWEEMLSFDGETGPYVQYAGARLASILRKAGSDSARPSRADPAYEKLADADSVLLTMLEFGPVLRRAIDKNEPSLLTQLMVRTASTIHGYLRDHHVLSAEEPTRTARLALVTASRKLLRTGLGLLGVASPDEM